MIRMVWVGMRTAVVLFRSVEQFEYGRCRFEPRVIGEREEERIGLRGVVVAVVLSKALRFRGKFANMQYCDGEQRKKQ